MANTKALGAVAFAFCSWAVYMGGLAGMQATCNANEIEAIGDGFSIWTPCFKKYGFYWFIMAFEFVLICAAGALAASGSFMKYKFSFVGLFAVATYLFIEATRVFLPIEDDPEFMSGQPLHRIRTVVAGCIMTCLANGFVILVMGIEDDYDHGKKEAPATATA